MNFPGIVMPPASAAPLELSARFRSRLLRGERLYGTLLSLPSPDVAEVLAGAGFDWLFVDGEHGALGPRDVLGILRAAPAVPCLVRTPPGLDAAVAHALDAGAAGIIVPQVHSAEQAARAAALARYPSAGTRGVGGGRAAGYGRDGAAYLAGANDAITVVVQAESAAAVENIAAIARTPGVDAVLVGPHDLAASLGHLGQPGHDAVQQAIGRIVDACRAAGRVVGLFGASAEAVRPWLERGVSLVVAGVDSALLGAAARQLRESLEGGDG